MLRDAYNHGRAIVETDAQIPFLLHRSDRNFLSLLANERPRTQSDMIRTRPDHDLRLNDKLVDVAEQLVDFLAQPRPTPE